MSKLIIFFITLCLFSCQSEQIKSIKAIESLSYQTGFNSLNAQIEYFNNKEYLCIADFQTYKKIVIHDLKTPGSNLVIPLDEITNLRERIVAFEIHNLDTIIILPNYSNIIYFINSSGEIWNKIDLNPYLQEEGYFELTRSITPFQFNDTTLIFSLNYLAKNLPPNARGDLYTYYQKRYEAPALFKIINIYADTLKTEFGLRNLYTNFSSNKSVNIEGNLFTFFEDKIVFNSAYSDSLYIINTMSLEIERKVAINSEYSDLSIPSIPINELQANPDLLNLNFRSNGFIRSILYDETEELYSVFAGHKPVGEELPWSIITLDGDFNKVGEIKMDDSKYHSKGFTTNKGLLISNYYETLNDSDHFEKNTFTLFSYE